MVSNERLAALTCRWAGAGHGRRPLVNSGRDAM